MVKAKLLYQFVRNNVMTLVALPVSGPSLSQSETHPLQPSGGSHVALFMLEDLFTSFKKTFYQVLMHWCAPQCERQLQESTPEVIYKTCGT